MLAISMSLNLAGALKLSTHQQKIIQKWTSTMTMPALDLPADGDSVVTTLPQTIGLSSRQERQIDKGSEKHHKD
jgi:hypothetical protein